MSPQNDDELARAWAAVRSAGTDVTPRRVLADMLLARGDPQGEFLQLCLTSDEPVDDAMRKTKSARAEALLEQHGATWFPHEPWDKARSRRRWSQFSGGGFPDSVAVFSWGPPAVEVLSWFTARYPLRRVAFVGVDPSPGLTFLEEHALFGPLTELDLDQCTFTDPAVACLARVEPGLRKLHINAPRALEGDRADRLLRGRGLSSVTSFGLSNGPVDRPMLHALWSALPSLEQLHLYQLEFDRQAFDLPRTKRRTRAFHLEGKPTPAQVCELVSGLDLSALIHLQLRVEGNLEGLFELLRDETQKGLLTKLTALDLESNFVNDAGLSTLLEAPPPNLVRLSLGNNSIGENGMKALAAYARATPTLRSLPLFGNFIGSGVFEDSTDWDGTVIGSSERGLESSEVALKFQFPPGLSVH